MLHKILYILIVVSLISHPAISMDAEESNLSEYMDTPRSEGTSHTQEEDLTEEDPVPPPTSAKRKLSIHLVDDNATILMAETKMLKGLGHEVTTSSSGEEVLQKIRDGLAVDVILIDQNMNGMLGTDAAKEIRLLNDTIVIIGVTSEATTPRYLELKDESGMDDCLSKPVTKEELNRVIDPYTNSVADQKQPPADK